MGSRRVFPESAASWTDAYTFSCCEPYKAEGKDIKLYPRCKL